MESGALMALALPLGYLVLALRPRWWRWWDLGKAKGKGGMEQICAGGASCVPLRM